MSRSSSGGKLAKPKGKTPPSPSSFTTTFSNSSSTVPSRKSTSSIPGPVYSSTLSLTGSSSTSGTNGSTFKTTLRNLFGQGKQKQASQHQQHTSLAPQASISKASRDGSQWSAASSRSELPDWEAQRNDDPPPIQHRASVHSVRERMRRNSGLDREETHLIEQQPAPPFMLGVVPPTDLSTITEMDTSGASLTRKPQNPDESISSDRSILGGRFDDSDPTTIGPLPPPPERFVREKSPETPSFDLSPAQIANEVREAIRARSDNVVSEWLMGDGEGDDNVDDDHTGRGHIIISPSPSPDNTPTDHIPNTSTMRLDEFGALLPSVRPEGRSTIAAFSTPSRKSSLSGARPSLASQTSSSKPRLNALSVPRRPTSGPFSKPEPPTNPQLLFQTPSEPPSPTRVQLLAHSTNRRMSSDSYIRSRVQPPPSPLGSSESTTPATGSSSQDRLASSTSRFATPSRAGSYASTASSSIGVAAGSRHPIQVNRLGVEEGWLQSPMGDNRGDITERSRTFLARSRKRSMSLDQRSPSVPPHLPSTPHLRPSSAASVDPHGIRDGRHSVSGSRPTTEWLGPRTAKAFAAAGLLDSTPTAVQSPHPKLGTPVPKYGTLSSMTSTYRRREIIDDRDDQLFSEDTGGRRRFSVSNRDTEQEGEGLMESPAILQRSTSSRYTHARSHSHSNRTPRSYASQTASQRSESRLSSAPGNPSYGRSSVSGRTTNTASTSVSVSPRSATRTHTSGTHSTTASPTRPTHRSDDIQRLKDKHAMEMEALLSALGDSQRTCKMMRDENDGLREKIRVLEEQLDAALAQGSKVAVSRGPMGPPTFVPPSWERNTANLQVSSSRPVSSSGRGSISLSRSASRSPLPPHGQLGHDIFVDDRDDMAAAYGFRPDADSADWTQTSSSTTHQHLDSTPVQPTPRLKKRRSGTSSVFPDVPGNMTMLVHERVDLADFEEDMPSQHPIQGMQRRGPTNLHISTSTPRADPGRSAAARASAMQQAAPPSPTTTSTEGDSLLYPASQSGRHRRGESEGSPRSLLYLRPEHELHLNEMDGISLDFSRLNNGEDGDGL